MKPMKYILLIASVLYNITAINAQENIKKSKPVVFAQQEVIHSSILKEDKIINICLPENFHEVSKEHTYPVLLLLENEFFQMVSGVVKHMSSVERMPETIVVSLTDGAHVPKLYTNGSDNWPKDWTQLPFGGDPDPFTSYLEKELLPYLKEKYRANDFRMVMGLSTTSIYTLHAFAKEPDLFNVFIGIASGDILGMGYKDGESFGDLFVNEFQNNKLRYKNKYLYLTSSDSDDKKDSHKIQHNLESLEKRLSPYRTTNFKFISKIFSNEGHYDVALPALYEALNMVFPKEKWSAKYRDIIIEPGSAMNNIDSYFKKISNEYGFNILPKAERWNSVNRLSWIGSNLLKQGKAKEAIDVLERWTVYRPKSITALSELAKAYKVNKEYKNAIEALEKAYKISLKSILDEFESKGLQKQISDLKKLVKN